MPVIKFPGDVLICVCLCVRCALYGVELNCRSIQTSNLAGNDVVCMWL